MKYLFLLGWFSAYPLLAQLQYVSEEYRQALKAQKEADFASAIPLDYGLENYVTLCLIIAFQQ